jgi:hypothetical protein
MKQLSFGRLILDPEAHRLEAMRKPRRCLSCDRQFNSHGPGNRICLKCKNLDTWNSGVPSIAVHAAI